MNWQSEERWKKFHAELMQKASAAKLGPEAVFSLFSVYEGMSASDRRETNAELRLEILSDDAGLAFDAQAIACRFGILELLPAIEERVRRLSLVDTSASRAELLTSLNFLKTLRQSTTSARAEGRQS